VTLRSTDSGQARRMSTAVHVFMRSSRPCMQSNMQQPHDICVIASGMSCMNNAETSMGRIESDCEGSARLHCLATLPTRSPVRIRKCRGRFHCQVQQRLMSYYHDTTISVSYNKFACMLRAQIGLAQQQAHKNERE
jgi:hypothetical protein